MTPDIDAEVDRLIDERGGRELLLPPYDDRAVEVGPGIVRSQGSTASYAVRTTAGRVIVNAGKGAEAGHHRALFDAAIPGDTTHIVTTQAHTDHVGGVATLRDPGTVYVAHEANVECQADNARIAGFRARESRIWFRPHFSRQADMVAASDVPFVQDTPTPDITFSESYRFDVGGRLFELIHTPGETVDSSVVWMPEEKICFSSNTLGPLFPHFPNFNTLRGDRNRQVIPWLDTVDRIRGLGAERLITGRGAPIVGAEVIRASLTRLHDAIDHVHRFTLDGMNAGVDLHTLMRTVELPAELRVGESYGKLTWAIRTIWENYTGWFRRQSTTELYPVDREDALAELVGLAGTDAVVERAVALVAAGDAVTAIHLLEGVLRRDPDHAGAVAGMIDAHRRIVDDSDRANFWEYGWLVHQIERWSQPSS